MARKRRYYDVEHSGVVFSPNTNYYNTVDNAGLARLKKNRTLRKVLGSYTV